MNPADAAKIEGQAMRSQERFHPIFSILVVAMRMSLMTFVITLAHLPVYS